MKPIRKPASVGVGHSQPESACIGPSVDACNIRPDKAALVAAEPVESEALEPEPDLA